MTEKIKVGFVQLSSCWGCYQSLIDLHEGLLDILPLLDIKFWPAVLDFKERDLEAMPDGYLDVGFIEGMIRTSQDKHATELIRKKAKLIVCLGACAVLGGIPGLGNLYTKDELEERKFKTVESIENTKGPPLENVPVTEECVELVKSVIPVDAFIPGCPPTPDQIKGGILYLSMVFNDKKYPGTNVCSVCEMRGNNCLLNQDTLCFGSITQSIPDLKWTKTMGQCLGDYGFTDKIADPEVKKLTNLVIKKLKNPLKEVEIKHINEFLILFMRLSNLGYLYSPHDPIQVLSTKRDELQRKKIEIEGKNYPIYDVNLPNYPEATKNIIGMLMYGLSKDEHFGVVWKSVCATCPRNIEEKHLKTIKRDYEGIANPNDCLLEQGYLCLGPATQAGCGALCPRAGVPCLGCYGPTANTKDIGAKYISALASISTEMSPEEIMEKIPDPAGLFYRFQLPASILHRKVEEKKKK